MGRAYPSHARVIRAREGGSLIKTTEIKERDMNRHRRRRITQITVTAVAALSLPRAPPAPPPSRPSAPKQLKDNAVTPQEDQERRGQVQGHRRRRDPDGRPERRAPGSAPARARAARRRRDHAQAGQRRGHEPEARRQRRGLRAGRRRTASSAGDLAANSVGSSEVAPNSVLAGDIGPAAITGSELGPNSVQGDEVENGSLDAVDVGLFSGVASANLPNIAAGACGADLIDPAPGATSIDGRAVLVTPDAGFFGNVSFHAEAEGTQIRIKSCNSTGAPIDPDGAGANYAYIVFG